MTTGTSSSSLTSGSPYASTHSTDVEQLMVASVVISTYNRADALEDTLLALARQDIATEDYEVLVVDDGSTDLTPTVLATVSVACRLRTFRLPSNRGVSAGRNVGLSNAQ